MEKVYVYGGHACSHATRYVISSFTVWHTIAFMSCPLAKITMIFFANFLYWKENRGFAANKDLGIF